MCNWSTTHEELFRKHTKAIVHMRKQQDKRRLSLVFGAGISKNFGVPDWDQLVKSIARHPDVLGTALLKGENLSQTSKTQMLFQRFKSKHNKNMHIGEIKAEWREIIRKKLYGRRRNIKRLIKSHPYISEYIPIIKRSPITITYNFDDFLEKIVLESRTETEKRRSRCYETAWNPRLQLKSENPMIYHPNGFLPENPLERPSDGLVFCEDEFADQLIETMAGRYASLLHFVSMQTCLLIGLSLNDSTLKHLLRQSAKMNPGHFHYYVAFQTTSGSISDTEKEAIFEANFTLYNFITLFLTAEEIKILGNLISLDHSQLDRKAGRMGLELSYCYYVTGAIAVGKSSVISYFGDLNTYDEWLDLREPLLLKPFRKLNRIEKRIVDNWIADQFSRKNYILTNPAPLAEGIDIVDRGPLDPLAFTPKEQCKRKAKFLLNTIIPPGSSWHMKKGHIVLLYGEPKRLEQRSKSVGKKYKEKALDNMQNALKHVYNYPGMSIVNTSDMNLDAVVKEVARIIHVNKYDSLDLERRLKEFIGGTYTC